MTYTSLQSPNTKDYNYELNAAHLYGNLMNTYGDNGNILMMKYVGAKLGAKMTFNTISLEGTSDADYYNMVFFGGGQNYEQTIIAKDLPSKKEAIADFINRGKVVLAIYGDFQLLSQYHVQANGEKVSSIGVMRHYTLNQENSRFIGNIKIHNDEFDETYYGSENHQGRTPLSNDEELLGIYAYGSGNNKEDGTEGVHYKNIYGSYFHGPIPSRNASLAYRPVTTALKNKYGFSITLSSYDDILSKEVAERYADTKNKTESEK